MCALRVCVALHRRRRQPVGARAALSPDNASVFVAGGGGIALDVTRRLKDMGAWVWMMQRNESRRWGFSPLGLTGGLTRVSNGAATC